MKLIFDENKIDTNLEHSINSLIMEQASNTAEHLTEMQCGNLDTKCWIQTADGIAFTEYAQEIFNDYYDEQMSQLYKLINNQLKLI